MTKYIRAPAFGAIGAAVVSGVFVIVVAASPVMAERGGGGHGGGGHGGGGARSAGHASAGSPGRSFSGGGGRSAGRVSAGRVFGNRHSGQRRRGAVYGYSSGQTYGGNCSYYYSRALATGSDYWWQLYDDCVGDY